MTHFERLGLPIQYDLDTREIERAFLSASRAVHPDHHAGGQDDTAAVNAAYHTLRDPYRRAEYLLDVLAPGASAPSSDPEFLMEMMEVRERAEIGDASVAVELSSRLTCLTAFLARQFQSSDYAAARQTLAAAKTVRLLLDDLADD